jgi:hypothetical protein
MQLTTLHLLMVVDQSQSICLLSESEMSIVSNLGFETTKNWWRSQIKSQIAYLFLERVLLLGGASLRGSLVIAHVILILKDDPPPTGLRC